MRTGVYGRRLLAGALAALLCLGVGCTEKPDRPAQGATPNYAVMERELEKYITQHEGWNRQRFPRGQGAPELQAVRAVLVSRDGETVLAHYRDSTESEFVDVWSVTKSVMSILIGIAVDEGYISDLGLTLGKALPAYRSQMSDQVAAITLRQLLTMTAGLPAQSPADGFALSADDAVGLILAHGLVGDPGAMFGYSNASAHLAGAVLANATDRPVLDYARQKLFDPLGIATRPAYEGWDASDPKSRFEEPGFGWAADRQGINTGCCLLKLTAPDMAKLGELYLNQGAWHGRRIVSAEWVRDSTTAQVTSKQMGEGLGDVGYGYFWWTLKVLNVHRAYAAVGAYGQLILIVPDLRLIVAVSSRDDGSKNLNDAVVPMITKVILAPLE
jgi:CubicO group peptidase (beta-lactamase class C family)